MPPETKKVTLTWQEGLRFSGGEPGRPSVVIDGDNETGPGPMTTLLLAAAACTGSDVVSILQKMRVSFTQLGIEVAGMRREENPRRYISIHFEYRVAGEGVDPAKIRRAIDLSLEKYCSVIHSLGADIAVTYGLALG
jgi:putative redox protein